MIEVEYQLTGQSQVRKRYHTSRRVATLIAHGAMAAGDEETLLLRDLDTGDTLEGADTIHLAGEFFLLMSELEKRS